MSDYIDTEAVEAADALQSFGPSMTAQEVEGAFEVLMDPDLYKDDRFIEDWSEIHAGYRWDHTVGKATRVPEPLGHHIPGFGHILKIYDHGGMDMGSELYVVIQVTSEDLQTVRLFRKDGYYQSHYGSDWDGTFREVTAQERTITVYE